jgi:hypothetical protein
MIFKKEIGRMMVGKTAKQRKVEETTPSRIEIRRLFGRPLNMPLVAEVEPAHPGFMAHAVGISVFGYGGAAAEAIKALKEGIEDMCRGEEFLDRRATAERMLLLANLMAGKGRRNTEQREQPGR